MVAPCTIANGTPSLAISSRTSSSMLRNGDITGTRCVAPSPRMIRASSQNLADVCRSYSCAGAASCKAASSWRNARPLRHTGPGARCNVRQTVLSHKLTARRDVVVVTRVEANSTDALAPSLLSTPAAKA